MESSTFSRKRKLTASNTTPKKRSKTEWLEDKKRKAARREQVLACQKAGIPYPVWDAQQALKAREEGEASKKANDVPPARKPAPVVDHSDDSDTDIKVIDKSMKFNKKPLRIGTLRKPGQNNRSASKPSFIVDDSSKNNNNNNNVESLKELNNKAKIPSQDCPMGNTCLSPKKTPQKQAELPSISEDLSCPSSDPEIEALFSEPKQPSAGLPDIPPELRDHIYSYMMPAFTADHCDIQGALLTCKALNQELNDESVRKINLLLNSIKATFKEGWGVELRTSVHNTVASLQKVEIQIPASLFRGKYQFGVPSLFFQLFPLRIRQMQFSFYEDQPSEVLSGRIRPLNRMDVEDFALSLFVIVFNGPVEAMWETFDVNMRNMPALDEFPIKYYIPWRKNWEKNKWVIESGWEAFLGQKSGTVGATAIKRRDVREMKEKGYPLAYVRNFETRWRLEHRHLYFIN